MTRSKKKGERGFALLIVVLLVALVAVIAVTLLDLISVDLDLVGHQRRLVKVQQIADGAMMEHINRVGLPNSFPLFRDLTILSGDGPNAEGRFWTAPQEAVGGVCAVPPCSVFLWNVGGATRHVHSGQVDFVRLSIVSETSMNLLRALTYEIRMLGDINNGQATAEVRTQLVQLVGTNPGMTRAPRYGR